MIAWLLNRLDGWLFNFPSPEDLSNYHRITDNDLTWYEILSFLFFTKKAAIVRERAQYINFLQLRMTKAKQLYNANSDKMETARYSHFRNAYYRALDELYDAFHDGSMKSILDNGKRGYIDIRESR